MKSYLNIRLILLIIIIPYMAQGQAQYLQKAEKATAHNNYVKAAALYQKAFEKEKDKENKKKIAFLIGNSFSAMNQTDKAIPWYQDAIAAGTDKAGYYIAYAKAISRKGQFENALANFRKANEKDPGNKEALSGIESVKMAIEARKMDSPVEIKKAENLNTRYSEFGPGWFDDKLVFASTRLKADEEKIDGRTGQGYSDLYISSYDAGRDIWLDPKIVSGILNSRFNDGTFAYDKSTGTAYTMRCDEKSENCVIIASQYDALGDKWMDGEEIKFNLKDYSVGHPSITPDGTCMYFVSDMSGGYGGKDIWKSNKKSDGSWGLPINLGSKVNSPKNEMFPFILGDSILFFASNRDYGYGGLDIFYALTDNFEFARPVNLGAPFNSTADDFGMIIRKNLKGGVFCSNRNTETSDDIYGFNAFPLLVKVEGKVTDINKKIPVANATVSFSTEFTSKSTQTDEDGNYSYYGIMPYEEYKIQAESEIYHPESRVLQIIPEKANELKKTKTINFSLTKKIFPVAIKGRVTDRATGEGMEGEKLEIKSTDAYTSFTETNAKGIYAFEELKPKTEYTVRVSKEGYFSESRSIKIPEVDKPRTFSKESGYDMDFQLTMIEKKKEIVLNNIYYDFDKATLRPDSKIELNKLASMLRETPEVVIQINSHTDERGSNTYNQKLSDRRARSVVDYLISQGIRPVRMISKGYGEEMPLVKNARTEEDHQKNRRTSFKVMEILEESPEQQAETKDINKNLEFRVQLMSTKQPIPGYRLFGVILDSIPDTEVFVDQEDDMFKYQIGTRHTLKEAIELKNKIVGLGYTDCFINAYYKREKISIDKAKEVLEQN